MLIELIAVADAIAHQVSGFASILCAIKFGGWQRDVSSVPPNVLDKFIHVRLCEKQAILAALLGGTGPAAVPISRDLHDRCAIGIAESEIQHAQVVQRQLPHDIDNIENVSDTGSNSGLGTTNATNCFSRRPILENEVRATSTATQP